MSAVRCVQFYPQWIIIIILSFLFFFFCFSRSNHRPRVRRDCRSGIKTKVRDKMIRAALGVSRIAGWIASGYHRFFFFFFVLSLSLCRRFNAKKFGDVQARDRVHTTKRIIFSPLPRRYGNVYLFILCLIIIIIVTCLRRSLPCDGCPVAGGEG